MGRCEFSQPGGIFTTGLRDRCTSAHEFPSKSIIIIINIIKNINTVIIAVLIIIILAINAVITIMFCSHQLQRFNLIISRFTRK